MPIDTLPERFAKTILIELADIHALLLSVADHNIAVMARMTGLPVAEITRMAEEKRTKMAEKIHADLLAQVNLSGQSETKDSEAE